MRISPVNNNKQNSNFGMLKVTDADKPELVQEAWRLLIDIMPNHAENPYRITEALNEGYQPGGRQVGDHFERDGGHYIGKWLLKDRLSDYAKEGDKIFIYDRELDRPAGSDSLLADRFERAFNALETITMEDLRKLVAKQKAEKSAVEALEAALAQVKANALNTLRDTFDALGASVLYRPSSR